MAKRIKLSNWDIAAIEVALELMRDKWRRDNPDVRGNVDLSNLIEKISKTDAATITVRNPN